MKTVKSQRVLNYLKKHNCNLVLWYSYGIQKYKVYRDGKELNYPYVNEDIFCEIRDKLQIISGYPKGGRMYSLKDLIIQNNNQ